MALTKFEDDLNVIQKLDDEPNDVGGLSAEELKAKFDAAPLAIQQYINEVLIPDIENLAVPGTGDFKADGSIPATGDFRMGGCRITGLGAPENDDDAVTKKYLSDNHYAKDKNLSSETRELYGMEEDATPDEALAVAYSILTGKAKIQTGSYIGTGTYGSSNPCKLEFDFTPRVLIVLGAVYSVETNGTFTGNSVIFTSDMEALDAIGSYYDSSLGYNVSTSGTLYLTFANNAVSWYCTAAYADLQLNSSGTTYRYIAIG